jgi:2-isopropylmalate synthase
MLRDPNRVRIFDTTLRDGEQSAGVALHHDDKRQIAESLGALGVDVIEAGFPASSSSDWEAVHSIACTVGAGRTPTPSGEPPTICALARATPRDIDAAQTALSPAAKPCIHTFLAVSEVHMQHKLQMSPGEVIERVARMVAYAKTRCEDVEFSAEDAGRADPDFLCEVLAVAIRSGATTVNIPDTVGYTLPHEYGELVRYVIGHTPGLTDPVVVSVHCHDDLGLATANTLAGVASGARQVEVTINGIGERAGNTPLEEVVMALHTRTSTFGKCTGIDTTRLLKTSRLVSAVTEMLVPPNKAIVGDNAFAHESGIHQDGMLKHHETYEIIRPEIVGSDSRLVLGKHSGRHAVRKRLVELGHHFDRDQMALVFEKFKTLTASKKQITDEDLLQLLPTTGSPLPMRPGEAR